MILPETFTGGLASPLSQKGHSLDAWGKGQCLESGSLLLVCGHLLCISFLASSPFPTGSIF